MSVENDWDHAECMCNVDERCRYHQALDRAETLAAENAALKAGIKSLEWCEKEDSDNPNYDICPLCNRYRSMGHRDTCPLVPVLAALAANPQAAPAPAEREQ